MIPAGVAMALSVKLVSLTPAELIPIALTKSMIRCMLSAAKNKKHTLHDLSKSTLMKLTNAAGSSPQVRLALASTIVHYGGILYSSSIYIL